MRSIVREGLSIGAITLRRFEVNPSRQADRHAANLRGPGRDRDWYVRLFRRGAEPRRATSTESLEQQTATSEVLR